MVAIVTVVAIRLFMVRLGEMREKRIHPQQVATSRQVAERLQAMQASDNFRNLFEVPVLFYALCALIVSMGEASAFFAVGGWLFVLLRAGHSYIHCTYNKVTDRFALFAASSAVLLGLWIGFAFVAVKNHAA